MKQPFNIDALYNIMAELSEIDIQPEWQASVKSHLEVAHKMADIIANSPIDDTSLELSNTFIPGRQDV